MAEDYQRIMQELSSLRRRVAQMHQVGTVHEVKGTKVRVSLGKDGKGQDVLSPWLNTSNHRGGATEQRFYKKGQTLTVICPNGDMTQGMIAPFAPSKDFRTPEHADGSGQDEESYQLDDYRAKQTKDGTDTWLQADEKKQQQAGSKQKGHVGGSKATMKTRMNKSGGITHRVGTDNRIAAHKEGAKIRSKSHWVVVTKDNIILSVPPIIKRDPIPNDDA
jgi:hypothetical protein